MIYKKLPEFIQKLFPNKFDKMKRELVIDDINPEDKRQIKDGYGVLIECHYCRTDLLIDGNENDEDYGQADSLIHCDDCLIHAQRNNT